MKKNLYLLTCSLLLGGFSYTANAQAPAFTGGHTQNFSVCLGSSANSVDTLMAVSDTSTGHTVNWNVVTAPAHGTLAATYTATSAAGTLTPTGLSYTPAGSYSGTDTFVVRFTDGAAADTTTVDVSVDTPLSPGVITGPGSVCVGASITLVDTVAGGSWSAVNPTATITGAGVVSGVTLGTDSVSYLFTNGCGIFGANAIVNINSLPNAGSLASPDSACIGGHITLTPGGDPGGIWHSTNTVSATVDATGIVTGIAPGSSHIAYLVTNGCGADTAMAVVKVQVPVQLIIGDDTVCQFQMLTLLDLSPGGSWSSSNFLTAPVIGGIVFGGITAGEATISYTLNNACGATTATLNVTVVSNTDPRCAPATTGVNAVTNIKDELNIYPNPNNGAFTLNLSSGINESARVAISNIMGEKVKELNATTNQLLELQLGQPAGIYFVTVSTPHNVYTAKIVVQ